LNTSSWGSNPLLRKCLFLSCHINWPGLEDVEIDLKFAEEQSPNFLALVGQLGEEIV